MAILLNIVAVAFGAMAVLLGPTAPKRMIMFGLLAAILFIVSVSVRPISNWSETPQCERYSSFAEDC